MSNKKIKNFCIIAHIDHGKSTLSDRIIEKTSTVEIRKMQNQILDSLEIEKERGITVKSAVISLVHKHKTLGDVRYNLIDTPGHVDFSYEVSRSLAACEGAILLIDASQGVEAQTLANLYLAMDSNLEILPVINKIDLPSADIEKVSDQIENDLGLEREDIVCISAKSGLGIDELLDKIGNFFTSPKRLEENPLKALIFDSYFDVYRGAVILIRIFEGKIKVGEKVSFFHQQKDFIVEEIGLIGLTRTKTKFLEAGDVGYLILGIKSVSDIQVGDTITSFDKKDIVPLEGYKPIKPMVFAGIFPLVTDDYNDLNNSLEKLKINDSALH